MRFLGYNSECVRFNNVEGFTNHSIRYGRERIPKKVIMEKVSTTLSLSYFSL